MTQYSNTTTEKWYKEIKFLVKKVKNNSQLTKDQVVNATSDALINFIKMVDKRQIDITEYDKYKGMMFIVTKSMVNRQFQAANCKKIRMYRHTSDVMDHQPVNRMTLQLENKLDLSSFSSVEIAIFRWHTRNWPQKYIAKVLQVDINQINRLIKNMRSKLYE